MKSRIENLPVWRIKQGRTTPDTFVSKAEAIEFLHNFGKVEPMTVYGFKTLCAKRGDNVIWMKSGRADCEVLQEDPIRRCFRLVRIIDRF